MNYIQQLLTRAGSVMKAINDLFMVNDQQLLTNRPEPLPSTDSIAILAPEMALMQDIQNLFIA